MLQNKDETLNTRLDVDFAMKAAQLGVWEVDPSTDMVIWDDRCSELFGMVGRNIMPYEEAITHIYPDDTKRVDEAVKRALQLDSGGLYDVTYRTIGCEDKKLRWVRFIGQSYFNEAGKAERFAGIAKDMTHEMEARQLIEASEARYRQLSEDLDERVQQRTLELNAMNRDLVRSNQNLEKFAYIASHDLQEPLRKIQAFGDLLKSQHADGLGKGLDYLQRMQSAASRMSILITDLLTYSRISTRQQAASAVPLSQTFNQVLENLSLNVAETKAKIEVGELPTVQGDPSQLKQLFQNLLSNALKFCRKDEEGNMLIPIITIHTKEVAIRNLPLDIKPSRLADYYHRIDITDEGIGFEEKYTDRIFQIFQRLHGKSEYPGTGVGLAICEKVVLNHGGCISVTSLPDKGTTFSVYLPKM